MVPLGAPSGMQTEEKKEALGELLRMAREETPELWEESLNTLLSLIMKNSGDDEVTACSNRWQKGKHFPPEHIMQFV